MACITWELPNGDRYLVQEAAAHTPPLGAFNTGIVDWTCEGSTEQHEVDAMLEKQGLKLGDAIAWVTKKIGLKQCAPCKARQEILNNAQKLGWSETLKQIKETL